MTRYENIEAVDAVMRKLNDNDRWDEAGRKKRIGDERRAFRRARRLDLKWAGFFYACAVYCGAITAIFDHWGISLFGLAFAAVGAAFLDAGLRDLFEEGK